MQSHPSSLFLQVSHSEKSQGACTWSCEDAQHPAAIAEYPSTRTPPGAELSASHSLSWVMVSRKGQPQCSSKYPCQRFTLPHRPLPPRTPLSTRSSVPLLLPRAFLCISSCLNRSSPSPGLQVLHVERLCLHCTYQPSSSWGRKTFICRMKRKYIAFK